MKKSIIITVVVAMFLILIGYFVSVWLFLEAIESVMELFFMLLGVVPCT